MINTEFKRALEVDRKDLLFNSNKKKKTVVAPLIITYSKGNPPFKTCINEEIDILHEDQKM